MIIANDPDADRLAAAEVIGISETETDTDTGKNLIISYDIIHQNLCCCYFHDKASIHFYHFYNRDINVNIHLFLSIQQTLDP